MGKKNKSKHETSQNASSNLQFASSKIGKKNRNKKAFTSEKKKNLIDVNNSETVSLLKNLPISPNNLNKQNKKSKKSKNKHVISKQGDVLPKPVLETNNKRKRNKKNKCRGQGFTESPSLINTTQSLPDKPLSKSAIKKQKKLDKKNQILSSLQKKDTKNINLEKSPINNQSVMSTANIAKQKSIYSASSSDDELDDSSDDDEESNDGKTGIDNCKKNEEFKKSTVGIMKNSQSDNESDSEEDDDDADSSSEDDIPKPSIPTYASSKPIQNNRKLVSKQTFMKHGKNKIEGNANDSLDLEESDEETDTPSLDLDEEGYGNSEEDTAKKGNKTFSPSKPTDESRKRKVMSTKIQLQTKKPPISDVGENDSKDSSEDEEDDIVKARDFVNLEAEEGEETDEDEEESNEGEEETYKGKNTNQDEENTSEEEEAPPIKKSKLSYAEDGENENKVFINNLPPNTTEESLGKELAKAGKVASIIIPKNRDNHEECRGFAFVTVPDKETLEKLLKLDQVAEIDGQTINIRLYTNDKGGRGGRHGGFRGSPGGRGFRGGRGRGGFRGSPGGSRGGEFRGSPGGRGGGFRGSSNRGGGFRGSGGRDGGFRGSSGGRGGGFRGSRGGRGRGFRGGRGGSSE